MLDNWGRKPAQIRIVTFIRPHTNVPELYWRFRLRLGQVLCPLWLVEVDDGRFLYSGQDNRVQISPLGVDSLRSFLSLPDGIPKGWYERLSRGLCCGFLPN